MTDAGTTPRPGGRPHRQVTPTDTIWLNMDRPNNLMIIDSVMLFDGPVDWARLRTVLRRRLVERFPVFSQRAVDPSIPLGLPHWEDDPDFDLDRHLVRARLPEPGDDAALQHYIEAQLPRSLDRSRPLWEYHFIDGYGTGCAVLARFHHALADGAALMEVLLSTTDATPDGDLRPDDVAPAPPQDEPLDGLAAILGAAAKVAGTVAHSATSAAQGAFHLLEELPHLASHSAALVDALTLGQATGQVAGKLLTVHNRRSPLSSVPVPAKRVIWTGPHPLEGIKLAGRPAGATVNDVILSALAAALARYQADRGVDPVDLVTMVPVNLRAQGEPLPPELGNRFALVFLELPSGEYPPLERLALAKQRMDGIKHSPEAVITFGLIQAIGRTNPDLERLLVDFFSNKAFGVTTNVAGPRRQRYMAGTPMTGVLGWVPGSGRHSLGICILTYAEHLRVGFKADAEVVPDPEKLVLAFDECLDELLDLTSPRDQRPRRTAAARTPRRRTTGT